MSMLLGYGDVIVFTLYSTHLSLSNFMLCCDGIKVSE